MKRSRRPFSWVIEEYAFGAVALRDEIARHKREDGKRWGLFKAVGMRLFYVYCLIVTFILVGIGVLSQKIYWIKERKRSKNSHEED